jgi:ankyrin repeat protein
MRMKEKPPLSRVAEKGDEEVIKLLLAKNTNCSWTLLLAAEWEKEAMVKRVLEEDGVDLNPKDVLFDRTLSLAAEKGDEKAIQLLRAKDGINPNSRDAFPGRTALMLAVEKGCEAVVELDQLGRTPLLLAAAKGDEAVVKLLLAKDGVDLNCKEYLGLTSFSPNAPGGDKLTLAEQLLVMDPELQGR